MASNVGDENLYMSGGNFFDVIPYEGRYDAQSLAVFGINRNRGLRVIPQPELAATKGQVRDLKWINRGTGTAHLVVARNNEELLFLQKK